jgi:hypothetical protein
VLPARQVESALERLWKIDEESKAGVVFDLLCAR